MSADEKEAVLDALLPLLPAGVHENGEVLSVFSGVPLSQAVMEAAAGRPLAEWTVEEVPADWRARRARLGEGGIVVGGRILIRSPWEPPAASGLIDIVVERRGGAFGSGSHPTTQMCLALLLDVPVAGGAVDLGCGVGTLAIAAAKLGWDPVVGVDRVPVAIEVARENVARNGVAVDCEVVDLAVDPVPLAPLLLVNTPPPVHARVAEAMTDEVRHVIVSGIVAEEVEVVLAGYHAVGFEAAAALGTEDEWIALRLSC
ncbi:MAG TPA: 50S ribosomal protein L11 methyltransferase [Solirubrobacter sp.]